MKMLDYFYQNRLNLMINGLKDNTAYLVYRKRALQ